MTQHERIINYMEQYGSITPYDAFIDLGITKLSTRIGELKREGVKIEQRREKTENRFGEVCQYTRYWLAEVGEDAAIAAF